MSTAEPLSINVMLPMTGYVPGQFILVTVDISNRSNKCIAEVKLKLRRQVRYSSQTPYKQVRTVYNTLAKFQCSGVDAKGSAGYERRFLVPPEPPTRSDTIIRLEYFVEVTAKVPGMAYSPEINEKYDDDDDDGDDDEPPISNWLSTISCSFRAACSYAFWVQLDVITLAYPSHQPVARENYD
uniref:Arrestin_C domain-containing protein n=1 Tax=Anopheles melas TaxID=34690 RepID=A0A182UDS5_9DIPT